MKSVTASQTVEPLTGYTVIRARREFQNQSSLGFMTTSTNRQIDRAVEFLADDAYAGGLITTGACRRCTASPDICRQPHRGNTESIQRLQENNVHLSSGPMRIIGRGSECDDAQGQPVRCRSERSPARARVSLLRRLQVAGFDSNDLGFMRRADEEKNQSNWFQWRNFRPGRYVRTRNFNINQYSRLEFWRRPAYSGGNINSHWTFTNYYSMGGGYNLDAAPFRDRVTRGGPGVLGNPSK